MAYNKNSLSRNWEIRQWSPNTSIDLQSLDDGSTWYKTEMPRQIHEILISHGVIEDPCLPGGRLKECIWVAESDWIYRCSFDAEIDRQVNTLFFEGLDTLAEVYLNGNHVASHEDMFIPLLVDVSGLLQKQNELIIHFHSPHAWIESQTLPNSWEGKVAPHKLLRKCFHDFTSYLSGEPYFTNIGVFGEVSLEQATPAAIQSVNIEQSLAPDLSGGTLSISVDGVGTPKDMATLFQLRNPTGQVVGSAKVNPELTAENNHWTSVADIEVKGPDLWWPKGYGEQTLYTLEASLAENGKSQHTVSKNIGFRSIHIDEHLSCSINGIPIRLWGGNLAPITGWTHRWIPERAMKILDRAELCHMNCLRIWGGGEWYSDELYDEADRRGILLWNDFPNEYGPCPDTAPFLSLCKKEAEHLVKRLKHHPSIMLWCGGNEAHMGNDFDRPGTDLIGKRLYEEVYPEVCARIDPQRYYQANSPFFGAFPNDPTAGDTHDYTTTWFVPGVKYPVFTTENMRISAPPMRSMVRYVGQDQVWPDDYDGKITSGYDQPWPASWANRTSANSWRKIPAIEQYCDPVDGPSLIYAFGAAHGRHLRTSVEAHRRGRPSGSDNSARISNGHLVWKLNATWPHLYSNILDYYLEPYIPFYELKRAYEPVLLSFDITDHIVLWLTNDSCAAVKGTYRAVLYDMGKNSVLKEVSGPATAAAGVSLELTDLDVFGQFDEECVLFAELVDDEGRQLARSIDRVCIERYMRFPQPKLGLEIENSILYVSTDTFAKSIEILGDCDGDQFGWLFEDNYFDLMPWEKRAVAVLGDHNSGTIAATGYYSPYFAMVDYPK